MNFKTLCKAIILSFLAISVCTYAEARKTKKHTAAKVKLEKKKDKKVQKDSTVKKKETNYDKLVKNFADSAKGNFFSLYRTKDNKIYIEVNKKYSGRKFLAGGVVKTVSNPEYVNIGYKYNAPLYLQLEIKDSTVTIVKPNDIASSSDPQMKLAMERNYTPKTYRRFEVKTFSPDSQSVFFDATSIIKDLTPETKAFSVSTKNGEDTKFYSSLKSFKDNASINITENVDLNMSFMGMKIPIGDGTITSTVSFLLLKDSKMKPRIQDSRIGIFPTNSKLDISTKEDGFEAYRLATRWDLEPVDTTAWLEGKLTDVKKPIVWYVDNSFPEDWKPAIKKGILAWNAAFERIGLKNVMRVKDFPTSKQDPEFDPDNLKYNCIRYIPSAVMNAMGPSWSNPVTGEILNASVLVYNDVAKLVQNWRFIQTAQIDKRVRCKKLPTDMLQQSLVYVISHEIGHTLGLMHNMGASAAVPVDSLRSAKYTQKYGITPSIMDYARFNYVAQPSDKNKGLKLIPASLGVYDIYAIDWLYRPVPQAKNMWEESKIAGKIIDAKAGNRYYKYGAQQIPMMGDYDPSARSEDLSDNPIKAGNLGIKNLKYILPELNNWIKDDSGRTYRQGLYAQLARQYYRYLSNVLAQVGGIYLTQVKDGTPGKPIVVLDKKLQRNSLLWVINQLQNDSWIDNPEITKRFDLHVPYSNLLSYIIAGQLLSTVPSRIMLASTYSGNKGYSLGDYYNDLFKIFHGGKLTSQEMTLQRKLVENLTNSLSGGKKRMRFLSSDYQSNKQLIDLISPDVNCYPVSSESFGKDNYPYQKAVNVSTVDNSVGYSIILLEKIKNFANWKRHFTFGKKKAHYEYLYSCAKKALK